MLKKVKNLFTSQSPSPRAFFDQQDSSSSVGANDSTGGDGTRVRSSRGCQVLLVESNMSRQQQSKGLLELLGCDVKAVQRVDQIGNCGIYDLIFIEGQQSHSLFAKSQVQKSTGTRIPIVMISEAENTPGEDDRRLGVVDYLTQPLLAADIERILSVWLWKKRAVLDIDREYQESRTTEERRIEDIFADTLVLFRSEALHCLAHQDKDGLLSLADRVSRSARSLGLFAFADLCGELQRYQMAGSTLLYWKKLIDESHKVERELRATESIRLKH